MVGRQSSFLVTKRSLRNSDSSSGKRPRRVVQVKNLDDTVGLSRREEQELNKALYASLQENRRTKAMPGFVSQTIGFSRNSDHSSSTSSSTITRASKSTSDGSSTTTMTGNSSSSSSSLRTAVMNKAQKVVNQRKDSLLGARIHPKRLLRHSELSTNLSIDESSQDSVRSSTSSHNGSKRKIHAQRKFAQGCSLPGMANCTPVKFTTPSVKMLSSKVPKTEDFLTFLCLRGSSILPPHLDFFNFSREELPSCDESSYEHQRESTPDSTSTSSGANDEVAEAANVSTPTMVGRNSGGLLAKRSAARASAGTPETARGIVSLRQGLQRKVSTSSTSSSLARSPASSSCLLPVSELTNTPPSRYRTKFYFIPEKSPSPSKASGIRPGEFTPPSLFSSVSHMSSTCKFSPLVCSPSKFASAKLSLGSPASQNSSPSSSSTSLSSTSVGGASKRKRRLTISSCATSKVTCGSESVPSFHVRKCARIDGQDCMLSLTSSRPSSSLPEDSAPSTSRPPLLSSHSPNPNTQVMKHTVSKPSSSFTSDTSLDTKNSISVSNSHPSFPAHEEEKTSSSEFDHEPSPSSVGHFFKTGSSEFDHVHAPSSSSVGRYLKTGSSEFDHVHAPSSSSVGHYLKTGSSEYDHAQSPSPSSVGHYLHCGISLADNAKDSPPPSQGKCMCRHPVCRQDSLKQISCSRFSLLNKPSSHSNSQPCKTHPRHATDPCSCECDPQHDLCCCLVHEYCSSKTNPVQMHASCASNNNPCMLGCGCPCSHEKSLMDHSFCHYYLYHLVDKVSHCEAESDSVNGRVSHCEAESDSVNDSGFLDSSYNSVCDDQDSILHEKHSKDSEFFSVDETYGTFRTCGVGDVYDGIHNIKSNAEIDSEIVRDSPGCCELGWTEDHQPYFDSGNVEVSGTENKNNELLTDEESLNFSIIPSLKHHRYAKEKIYSKDSKKYISFSSLRKRKKKHYRYLRKHRSREKMKERSSRKAKKRYHLVKEVPKVKIRIIRRHSVRAGRISSKLTRIQDHDSTDPLEDVDHKPFQGDFQKEFLKMLQAGGVACSPEENGPVSEVSCRREISCKSSSKSQNNFNHKLERKENISQNNVPINKDDGSCEAVREDSEGYPEYALWIKDSEDPEFVQCSKKAKLCGISVKLCQNSVKENVVSHRNASDKHLSKSTDSGFEILEKSGMQDGSSLNPQIQPENMPSQELHCDNTIISNKIQEDQLLEGTHRSMKEYVNLSDSITLRDKVISAFAKFNRKDIIVSSIEVSKDSDSGHDHILRKSYNNCLSAGPSYSESVVSPLLDCSTELPEFSVNGDLQESCNKQQNGGINMDETGGSSTKITSTNRKYKTFEEPATSQDNENGRNFSAGLSRVSKSGQEPFNGSKKNEGLKLTSDTHWSRTERAVGQTLKETTKEEMHQSQVLTSDGLNGSLTRKKQFSQSGSIQLPYHIDAIKFTNSVSTQTDGKTASKSDKDPTSANSILELERDNEGMNEKLNVKEDSCENEGKNGVKRNRVSAFNQKRVVSLIERHTQMRSNDKLDREAGASSYRSIMRENHTQCNNIWDISSPEYGRRAPLHNLSVCTDNDESLNSPWMVSSPSSPNQPCTGSQRSPIEPRLKSPRSVIQPGLNSPRSPYLPHLNSSRSPVRPYSKSSKSQVPPHLNSSKSDIQPFSDSPRSPVQPYSSSPRSPIQYCSRSPRSPVQPCSRSPRSPVQLCSGSPRSPVQLCSRSPRSPVQPCSKSPRSPVQPCSRSPRSPVQRCSRTPRSPVQPCSRSAVQHCSRSPNSVIQPHLSNPRSPAQLCSNSPKSAIQSHSSSTRSIVQSHSSSPRLIIHSRSTSPRLPVQQCLTSPSSVIKSRSRSPGSVIQPHTSSRSLDVQSHLSSPRSDVKSHANSPRLSIQSHSSSPRLIIQSHLSSPESVIQSHSSSPRLSAHSHLSNTRLIIQSRSSSPKSVAQSNSASPRLSVQSCSSSPRLIIQSHSSSPRSFVQSHSSSPRLIVQSYESSSRSVVQSCSSIPRSQAHSSNPLISVQLCANSSSSSNQPSSSSPKILDQTSTIYNKHITNQPVKLKMVNTECQVDEEFKSQQHALVKYFCNICKTRSSDDNLSYESTPEKIKVSTKQSHLKTSMLNSDIDTESPEQSVPSHIASCTQTDSWEVGTTELTQIIGDHFSRRNLKSSQEFQSRMVQVSSSDFDYSETCQDNAENNQSRTCGNTNGGNCGRLENSEGCDSLITSHTNPQNVISGKVQLAKTTGCGSQEGDRSRITLVNSAKRIHTKETITGLVSREMQVSRACSNVGTHTPQHCPGTECGCQHFHKQIKDTPRNHLNQDNPCRKKAQMFWRKADKVVNNRMNFSRGRAQGLVHVQACPIVEEGSDDLIIVDDEFKEIIVIDSDDSLSSEAASDIANFVIDLSIRGKNSSSGSDTSSWASRQASSCSSSPHVVEVLDIADSNSNNSFSSASGSDSAVRFESVDVSISGQLLDLRQVSNRRSESDQADSFCSLETLDLRQVGNRRSENDQADSFCSLETLDPRQVGNRRSENNQVSDSGSFWPLETLDLRQTGNKRSKNNQVSDADSFCPLETLDLRQAGNRRSENDQASATNSFCPLETQASEAGSSVQCKDNISKPHCHLQVNASHSDDICVSETVESSRIISTSTISGPSQASERDRNLLTDPSDSSKRSQILERKLNSLHQHENESFQQNNQDSSHEGNADVSIQFCNLERSEKDMGSSNKRSKKFISKEGSVGQNNVDEREKKQLQSDNITLHSYGSLNTGQGFAMVNGQLQHCEILNKQQLNADSSEQHSASSGTDRNRQMKHNGAQCSRDLNFTEPATTESALEMRKQTFGKVTKQRKVLADSSKGLQNFAPSGHYVNNYGQHHGECYHEGGNYFCHYNRINGYYPGNLCGQVATEHPRLPDNRENFDLPSQTEQVPITGCEHPSSNMLSGHVEAPRIHMSQSEFSQPAVKPRQKYKLHSHKINRENPHKKYNYQNFSSPLAYKTCFSGRIPKWSQTMRKKAFAHYPPFMGPSLSNNSWMPSPIFNPHRQLPHRFHDVDCVNNGRSRIWADPACDRNVLRSAYMSDLAQQRGEMHCNSSSAAPHSHNVHQLCSSQQDRYSHMEQQRQFQDCENAGTVDKELLNRKSAARAVDLMNDNCWPTQMKDRSNPGMVSSQNNMQSIPEMMSSQNNMQSIPEMMSSQNDMQSIPEMMSSQNNMQSIPEMMSSQNNMQSIPGMMSSQNNMQSIPGMMFSQNNVQSIPAVMQPQNRIQSNCALESFTTKKCPNQVANTLCPSTRDAALHPSMHTGIPHQEEPQFGAFLQELQADTLFQELQPGTLFQPLQLETIQPTCLDSAAILSSSSGLAQSSVNAIPQTAASTSSDTSVPSELLMDPDPVSNINTINHSEENVLDVIMDELKMQIAYLKEEIMRENQQQASGSFGSKKNRNRKSLSVASKVHAGHPSAQRKKPNKLNHHHQLCNPQDLSLSRNNYLMNRIPRTSNSFDEDFDSLIYGNITSSSSAKTSSFEGLSSRSGSWISNFRVMVHGDGNVLSSNVNEMSGGVDKFSSVRDKVFRSECHAPLNKKQTRNSEACTSETSRRDLHISAKNVPSDCIEIFSDSEELFL